MTVMSRNQEDLLRRLVAFAGDAVIVQKALHQLNEELESPPTLDQVLVKILQLKNDKQSSTELAAR
jgi:hypothetical protein